MVSCVNCVNLVNRHDIKRDGDFFVGWCRTRRVDRVSGKRQIQLCSTERLFGWPIYLLERSCGKQGRFFEAAT